MQAIIPFCKGLVDFVGGLLTFLAAAFFATGFAAFLGADLASLEVGRAALAGPFLAGAAFFETLAFLTGFAVFLLEAILLSFF